MKKILLIAASAMMVFASCQKVDVIYENTNPQEIAMFAVNKNMTKAPVSGTAFDSEDVLRVTAYLAATGDGNNIGNYFTNIQFKGKTVNNKTIWTGGQYWPLSSATMNFSAVTEKGGKILLGDGKVTSTDYGVFTVILDNNKAETFNQTDLMYAVGRGTSNGDGKTPPAAVDMTFKHALSWVNFAFKTNVENIVTINSVKLTTRYNGTLTVNPGDFNSATENLNPTASWSTLLAEEEVLGINVPNLDNTASMGDLTVGKTKFDSYGNGLLVVPATTGSETFFEISYSILQSGVTKEYTYKHLLSGTTWEMGKKYTYNINITLHEIEVNPSVEKWDDTDEKDSENANDDVNWGAEVPLG